MFDDEKKRSYSGQEPHSGGMLQRGRSPNGGVPPECGDPFASPTHTSPGNFPPDRDEYPQSHSADVSTPDMQNIAAQLTAAWRTARPQDAMPGSSKPNYATKQSASPARPLDADYPEDGDEVEDFSRVLQQSRSDKERSGFSCAEDSDSIVSKSRSAEADSGVRPCRGAMPDLSSPLEAQTDQIRKKLPKKKTKSLSRHTHLGPYKPEQRILILDTWRRSGLPAKDFCAVIGFSRNTLYKWNGLFEKYGPAGLLDNPKGAEKGSKLPEITKRMILMIKESNPEAGCEMISDMLARSPGVPASATAVAKVLKEAGYEYIEVPTNPHPDKQRRFEREKPNMLWQTDIFTFTLKRLNRRVHLVVYMDDHSRFITGYGLRSVASTEMVIETLQAAVVAFGCPDELLTDNGPQYKTWRGKSKFTKYCESRGIDQILSKPRHPQTLGKVERFWRTIWEGFLSTAVFLDLEDARRRIGLFIDHYNFKRPHSAHGEGLVPADKFFGVAPEVMASMKKRMHENALEIAKKGFPKTPFYLTGHADGMPFSLHEENGRVYMLRDGGEREEVELVTPFDLERDTMEDSDYGFEQNMRELDEGLEDMDDF